MRERSGKKAIKRMTDSVWKNEHTTHEVIDDWVDGAVEVAQPMTRESEGRGQLNVLLQSNVHVSAWS